MTTEIKLRPAQAEVLKYQGGRMAVSAVPGSGKTFTLSLLAAELIAQGRVQSERDQQVLIVTYLNSSVDNFRAGIRARLEAMNLPPLGYDVRTLHSLSLEILRAAAGAANDIPITLDELQSVRYLAQAIDRWIELNPRLWEEMTPDESPRQRFRWRAIVERTAHAFIRAAKNERYRPRQILAALQKRDAAATAPSSSMAVANSFLYMLAGIYQRYQFILERQGGLDFNDLIWQATDLLEQRPDLTETLRQRWPFVLEDEAQDSVPLQEALLDTLTGPAGNWVRVGDPNQAITSSFTAAHPRYFNAFTEREDVVCRPLPNSGRCAPLILGAANHLVHWVCDKHPVPEVRERAFRRQEILPTPPGDAQPNPPDSEADIVIKVFERREDEELPQIARLAGRYAQQQPHHTLAILVPTNDIGYKIADQLDQLDCDYDNLLRGSGREREIAAALYALFSILADPLDSRALAVAHAALHELGHPAAGLPPTNSGNGAELNLERLQTILRSVYQPERLLFPIEGENFAGALPAGIATEAEERHLAQFTRFIAQLFALRPLPIDDLTLALADELFAHSQDEIHQLDLAISYQIANILRQWRDAQPEWRLPELAAQLADVVEGRRTLPINSPDDIGYKPEAGRITLATQHGAKGLEWDAVYLVGIDGFWIPGNLDAPFLGTVDFLGGDPTAEAVAQLHALMSGNARLHPGRSATESAQIEVICERLRLLYVGITRARRFLHISRSRATRSYNKDRSAEPATVLGVLYQYLKSVKRET